MRIAITVKFPNFFHSEHVLVEIKPTVAVIPASDLAEIDRVPEIHAVFTFPLNFKIKIIFNQFNLSELVSITCMTSK